MELLRQSGRHENDPGRTEIVTEPRIEESIGSLSRPMVAATLAAVITALPAFLVGGLSVLIRRDVNLSLSQLGFILSMYYVTGTALSIPGGVLADHLGGWRAAFFGVGASGLALAGIGVFAHQWWHLLIGIVVAGAANAVTQPATNLALAGSIRKSYQGRALGLKQAAVPAAAMLAGFSVPLVPGSIGWQGVFIAGALTLGVYVFVAPLRSGHAAPAVDSSVHRDDGAGPGPPPLLILAVAGGMGTLASSTLGPFFVVANVERGVAPELAGVLMGVGSAAGILVRIGAGWLIDMRSGGSMHTIAVLHFAGAAGFLLLAATTSIPFLVVATLLVFGAGWGWTGLFHYVVVRHSPRASGSATGVVLVGLRGGAIVGPLVFGYMAEIGSLILALTWSACSLVLGGSLFLLARRVWVTRQL